MNPNAKSFVPRPPALPSKPLNPNAKPFVPMKDRISHGYLYTPFGGDEALTSAIGENIARLEAGKHGRGLIAPNHNIADGLQSLRQEKLDTWGPIVQSGEQYMQNIGQHRRQLDNQLLANIKASVDAPHATEQSTAQARHQAKIEHTFGQDGITQEQLLHRVNLDTYKPKYEALKQTSVLNTTPGIYPSLYPNPPLQSMQPSTQYSKGDKLYVLGHGAPAHTNIYAKPDGTGGTLNAAGLAKHLDDAGLPKNKAMDVRLTACQGVPELDDVNFSTPEDTKTSGYLVPEFAKEMAKREYNHLTVTGYQGNGVTLPFGSTTHLRASPSNVNDRVKRSLAAIQYQTSEMK